VSHRGVIFDLGGVVLGSPLHAIAELERDEGIPAGFVNRLVADSGPAGAWQRLERGELGLEAFFAAFDRECELAGHALSSRRLMERIAVASQPRPAMLTAIRRIRERGLRAAARRTARARCGPTSTSSSSRAWWACASPTPASTSTRCAAWRSRPARRSSSTTSAGT
jgi:hypothetical protein